MKDSKNLVIGMLCAVVCVMAVAYAAFATTLTINGTASIESNWCVQIKNEQIACTSTPVTGGAPGSVTAEGTRDSNISASVTMTFSQPGDKASCTINFENCGDLKAKLSSIDVTGADAEGAIRFTVTKPSTGDKLEPKTGTHQVIIEGSYDSSIESQPEAEQKTKTVKVVAEYVQDMGE